jgi:hypothetical protein
MRPWAERPEAARVQTAAVVSGTKSLTLKL